MQNLRSRVAKLGHDLAYSAMLTEPRGPIYLCYDAMLQETPLTVDVALPPDDAIKSPTPMAYEAWRRSRTPIRALGLQRSMGGSGIIE